MAQVNNFFEQPLKEIFENIGSQKVYNIEKSLYIYILLNRFSFIVLEEQ